MKDSGAENCSPALLSPSSTTAWLTSSLCKQPPPHLSQRHSRCSAERPSLFRASGELSPHSHRQSVQGAERSRAQHAGKFFTCRFIQNIHKELRAGTQRAKATPPLARIGCWLLWRHACRHGNRLSDYYLFFIWPGFDLMQLMMWSPLARQAAAEGRPKTWIS